MFKLKTRKFPQYSNLISHVITGDKYFISLKQLEKTDGILPVDYAIPSDTDFLDNVEVILLDYGLGRNGAWSLVKIPSRNVNDIGYLPTRFLVPKSTDIKPLYELNQDNVYAADWMAEKIEWYKQPPYVMFDDKRNGCYCVNWEFPDVTEYSPATADQFDTLTGKMQEAFIEGTKLILKNNGFDISNTQILNKFLYDYYPFCRAEEWYVDIRPCSSLKILVSIPKRFIHTKIVESNKVNESTSINPDKEPRIPFENKDNQEEKVEYLEKVFNNYQEYKKFFDSLLYTLETYNLPFITREWSIDPYIDINFLNEIRDVKEINRKITNLIIDNAPKSVSYQYNSPIGIFNMQDKYFYFDNNIGWKDAKLTLVLDQKNIKLVNVKYEYNGKQIILTNNFFSFLHDPLLLNKTYINYFINFDPDKDRYNYFANIAQEFTKQNKEPTVFQEIRNDLVSKIASGQPLNDIPELINARITDDGQQEPNLANLAAQATSDVLSATANIFEGMAAIFGGMIHDDISKFLKDEHYPSVEAEVKPLDIEKCVMTNYELAQSIARDKIPEIIELHKQAHEQRLQERPKKESDEFVKASYDLKNILDPNLRILFQIDPIPGKNGKEKFVAFMTALNTFDWAKFLAFASQCMAQTIDPAILAELLKNYQNARKFIDNILSASVCNPFLTSTLRKINGITIPQINSNNSLGALAEAIEQAFIKMLMDLMVTLVKTLLNEAMKACMRNANSPFGGANVADPLANALDENDPQMNDLMNDLFDGFNNGSDDLKEEAKEKVKDFFDDISACLSTSELCKLLSNYAVNDEVYEFILALAKRKYKQPFVNKFEDREYVKNFFARIGSTINTDVCQDFLNEEQPRNTNFLCDDGRIQQLRTQILSDKGMSDEMIDELLKDIKDKETKLLEDTLKLLNSDNPFDFSQVPDLACQVFPNGETIAPPQKSMEKTIDALYDDLYTSFNEEAADWYKTTYSISSSKPSTLEFDESTGKIKTKAIDDKNPFKQSIVDSSKTADNNDRNKLPSGSSEIKIPFYLFQSTYGFIPNATSSYDFKYNKQNDIGYSNLKININAHEQQKLDLNIISDRLRKNVDIAEKTLNTALSDLMVFLYGKLLSEVFKVSRDITLDDRELFEAAAAQAFKNNEFYRYVKIIDMYLNSNIVDSYDVTKNSEDFYKILGFKTSQEAASFYSLDNGIPLYLLIADSFFNDDGTLKNVTRNLVNYATTINTANSNILLSSNTEAAQLLFSEFATASQNYSLVRKYYRTVLNTKILYPDFNFDLKTGMKQISIPLQKQVNFGNNNIETIGNQDQSEYTINQYSNNKLYDIYNLNITKNLKNYISITNVSEVRDETKDYIINNLNIQNLNTVTKDEIYVKYINSKFAQYITTFSITIPPEELFSITSKTIFESIKNNIFSNNNKFLYFRSFDVNNTSANNSVITEKSSSVGQAYTSYLKLVIEPTEQQKICKIRPHYLDMDSVKSEVKEKQKNNTCARQIINDDVVNQRPVDSNSIEAMETTATQKTILDGIYKLAIRLYLHDSLLRAISVFGYYDPQNLRNDKLFVSFLTDMIESEMRAADTAFFNMLTTYYYDLYVSQITEEKEILIKKYDLKILKRLLFKQLIEQELKNIVLPKLTKRIDIDTNITLKNLSDDTIKLVNIYNDIRKYNNIIKIKNKSVYLNTFSRKRILPGTNPDSYILDNNNIIFIKIYEYNDAANEDAVWTQFRSTEDFKLLFGYLFPVTQYLSSIAISSILCTNTRKKVLDTFDDTKRNIFRTAKSVHTGGRKVAPDPENPQTMDDENPLLVVAKFISKALIEMPLSIVKGFAEGSEPNLALVTTAYKLGKSFQPDLTSLVIPPVSIAGAVSGYLPAVNPILYWTYIITGMWYSDNAKAADKISPEEFFKRLQENTPPDCTDVINQDNYYVSTIDNSVMKDKKIGNIYETYYGVDAHLASPVVFVQPAASADIQQGSIVTSTSTNTVQENRDEAEKEDGFSIAGSKNSNI